MTIDIVACDLTEGIVASEGIAEDELLSQAPLIDYSRLRLDRRYIPYNEHNHDRIRIICSVIATILLIAVIGIIILLVEFNIMFK
jgi:type IV secretory pathway component VirB8